jgi:ATP/maltotriose-dependent transcriptional regulator MalT
MAGSAGVEEESEPVHITPREEQILNLIAGGKSNKQISSELFLSIETVKTHIKKIFTKLEVKSRLEAVAVARNLKIIE